MLHQNEGGISLDPRDFPRSSPSGNLSGLGKSLGRRGWISQYLPRFDGAWIHFGHEGKKKNHIFLQYKL